MKHQSDAPFDLDVVVPVWNEEQRIGRTLEAVTAHAATTGLRVLVTVVDNGSVDRTAEVVDRVDAATPERVSVRLLGCSRQGKGAAVRRGVLASRARWVGFCDADLATPPEALDDVLVRLRAGDAVVIGSRRCAGARVEVGQPLARRLGSLGFRALTRSVTGVADSQCGFKFFAAAAAREIFSRSSVDGFTFDVELLGLARRLGHAVTEVPVDWSDQAGSSLSMSADGPRILGEVVRVRRALAAAVPVSAAAGRAPGAAPAGRTVVVNWRDGAHPLAGGAELYCERVAAGLGAAGHDVVYLTSRPGGAAAHEDRGAYRVVRGGGTYGVYPFVLAWLLAHRRSVGAVLDSQNGIPFFTPLALARRTPALLLVHHVHQEQFSSYFGPLMARVGRFLEGPASRAVYGQRLVVAVSPSTRTGVRRRLRLRGAISVLPCGTDAPTGGGPASRSTTPRVVVVGRLVPHKRLHLVVAAMAAVQQAVPGAELHVVGDGPARADLERLAASATSTGLTVFHGRLGDAERDALTASAWLTVNPSAGEGWGLSVIEANAAGVPAMAYRVPGLQDSILPGRTGWLVEPGHDLGPALADALAELADPAVAQAYADAAREWAGRFSWEATAQGVALAVAIERDRLSAGRRDRRAGNDLVSVVDVPARLLAPGWERHQRQGDTWTVGVGSTRRGGSDGSGGSGAGSVRGLLRGADESDVSAALARLGVDRRDPDVRVVVARPADLLGAAAVESWVEQPAEQPSARSVGVTRGVGPTAPVAERP